MVREQLHVPCHEQYRVEQRPGQECVVATNLVRRMAAGDDRPYGGTELLSWIANRYGALDTDYSGTLLRMLSQVNIRTTARRLDVAFTALLSDIHTLVELLEPASQRWMLLDPVFGLSARKSNGAWATASDVSTATQGWNWSDISYVFLWAAGDAYVQAHHVDYPLLYLNVYQDGQPIEIGSAHSSLPYLQAVALPATGSPDAYAVRCTSSSTVDVIIDGTLTHVSCDGVDSVSAAFRASTVAAVGSGTPAFDLYRVGRFVF